MDQRAQCVWSAGALRSGGRAFGRLTAGVARGRVEVQRAAAELLDALWPRVCWLCRAPVDGGALLGGPSAGPLACAEHRLTALGLTGNRCARCARLLPLGIRAGERCRVCRARGPRFARVLAAGEYAEPLSEWVLALKHGGRRDLARPLGRHLAACVAEPLAESRAYPTARPVAGSALSLPHDRPLLCPVPLHPLRRLERGYDQALLLARALGEALELRVATLLVRLRATTPQGAEGGRATRRSNVAGAFGLARTELASRVLGRGPVAGRDVWLVDDVFTSGATADACAEVLRRGGARSVSVVVLARAGAHGRDGAPGSATALGGGRAPPCGETEP